MPFTAQQLEMISSTKEVIIETRSDGRVQRTVIWVVVDNDKVYVRSFRGASGRWYQQALANPDVAFEFGDKRIAARAVLASDVESIEGASDGFRRKYPKGRSLDAMLLPEVLDTTLRLEPIS